MRCPGSCSTVFVALLLLAAPAYGGAPGVGLRSSGAISGGSEEIPSPAQEGSQDSGEAALGEAVDRNESDPAPAALASEGPEGSEDPGETAEEGILEQTEPDWLTAPPDPDRHHVWIPALEWTVALSLVVPLFILEPDFVHTGELSANTFSDSWTKGPVWDSDGWVANYLFHPLMGSEAYLTLRNRDYGPFQSFLFSSAVSFGWEYLLEAWQERPSGQDLLVTSPVGSLLGELRFQTRRRLSGWEPSLGRNILIVLVDPIEAIHRYIGTCDDDEEEETAGTLLDIGPGQARVMFTMRF